MSSGFPWDWMIARALEAGISISDFWRLSPRAVITIRKVSDEARGQRISAERGFGTATRPQPRREPQPREPERVKLNYIPHP